MTTIGGPGGIGGARGPTAPDGAEPAHGADGIPGDVATGSTHGPARVAGATELEALAAELAAGRLTPHEATSALIERLVETTAGPAMDATERAELRELLTDLVTNDPYLGGLIGRI